MPNKSTSKTGKMSHLLGIKNFEDRNFSRASLHFGSSFISYTPRTQRGELGDKVPTRTLSAILTEALELAEIDLDHMHDGNPAGHAAQRGKREKRGGNSLEQ